MTYPFLSNGLQILSIAENARRLRVKAEDFELLAAAFEALSDDLASQGEEWRQVAADPTSRADVKLIEEALGLYSNFSADAAELRREANRLDVKAQRLNDRAVEISLEATEANREYLAEAKQATKYARLAATSTTPADNRRIDKAQARRQGREELNARKNVAALFARKAATAAAL